MPLPDLIPRLDGIQPLDDPLLELRAATYLISDLPPAIRIILTETGPQNQERQHAFRRRE